MQDTTRSPFPLLLSLKIYTSEDNSDERYYLYSLDDNIERDLQNKLIRGAQFLNRLFLGETPFLLISSDAEGLNEQHLGWGVYFASVKEWNQVLESECSELMVTNETGQSLTANLEEGMRVSIEEIQQFHDEHNLCLFYIKAPSPAKPLNDAGEVEDIDCSVAVDVSSSHAEVLGDEAVHDLSPIPHGGF